MNIGDKVRLELKSKTPIIFSKFSGGVCEPMEVYEGVLVGRIWSPTKQDFRLKFLDNDGTNTYLFEGVVHRKYNSLIIKK